MGMPLTLPQPRSATVSAEPVRNLFISMLRDAANPVPARRARKHWEAGAPERQRSGRCSVFDGRLAEDLVGIEPEALDGLLVRHAGGGQVVGRLEAAQTLAHRRVIGISVLGD